MTRRLLIIPLISVALLALLTVALVIGSDRQSTLLSHVAEDDLADFERQSLLVVRLAERHLEAYGLLKNAPHLPERDLIEQTAEMQAGIRVNVARMHDSIHPHPVSADEGEDAPTRREVLRRAREYLRSISLALDLMVEDPTRAAGQVSLAADRLALVNRAYASLVVLQRSHVRSEVLAHMRESRIGFAASIALGLIGSMLLFWTSLIVIKRHRHHEVELERRVAERTRELSAANAELTIYAEVIRSTGDSVAITNALGRIVEVNPAFERITGVARENAIGIPLFGALAGPDPEAHRERIWGALRSQGHWSGEAAGRRRDGQEFLAWVTANAVQPADGGPTHFVSLARDITALKDSEHQLQKLAFFDSLTGLPNRALLNDRLTVALATAQRNQEKLALVYIDLDRFKQVNDTLGHNVGDRLLEAAARRMETHLRPTDTLARLGADEFVVVLTDLRTESEATAIAERILDSMGQPFDVATEPVFVGASLGLSFFPRDGADAETLRRHGYIAMYEVKQAGRGQLRHFGPDMIDRANLRRALGSQLEAALTANAFSLRYQPIVDVNTGETRAAEALIRWRDRDGNFVSPAVFIPYAEEAGLIKRIDAWVLENACRDASGWSSRAGREIEVSVNLSAVSLQQADLPATVASILERTGLPAHQLHVEITETAVMESPHAASEVLRAIAAMGVGISMDDFGTGHSSLNYLIQFPIDRIKLDRSFVDRIGRDPASEAIIRSVLELAGTLDLSVVAEGVEEPHQRDFLASAECGLIQGYLFSKPLSNDELVAHVARGGYDRSGERDISLPSNGRLEPQRSRHLHGGSRANAMDGPARGGRGRRRRLDALVAEPDARRSPRRPPTDANRQT